MKSISEKNGKKGNILTENLIFIILNVVFFSIILLFIFIQMNSAAVLEERYAKQIALVIDEAKPVMVIDLEMGDAIRNAEGEGWPIDQIVSIEGNIVFVRLREKGGYYYSFFNDVKVEKPLLNTEKGGYVFVINPK